jgi:hypothetical protein
MIRTLVDQTVQQFLKLVKTLKLSARDSEGGAGERHHCPARLSIRLRGEVSDKQTNQSATHIVHL